MGDWPPPSETEDRFDVKPTKQHTFALSTLPSSPYGLDKTRARDTRSRNTPVAHQQHGNARHVRETREIENKAHGGRGPTYIRKDRTRIQIVE